MVSFLTESIEDDGGKKRVTSSLMRSCMVRLLGVY